MTPLLDELKEDARILAALLDDPQPGLITWRQALYERIRKIAEFLPDAER